MKSTPFTGWWGRKPLLLSIAALDFYFKNGFVPLNEDDADEPTRLLYFDLNDLDEE